MASTAAEPKIGGSGQPKQMARGIALLAPPVVWMLIIYLIPLAIKLDYAYWSDD
jgi:hypothetical protein